MNGQEENPYCFGKLEIVFPLAADGLRHTPESCMFCIYKTKCLQTAMGKQEGLRVKEENIDKAYAAGVIGFFERWARKKDFKRKRKMMDADDD